MADQAGAVTAAAAAVATAAAAATDAVKTGAANITAPAPAPIAPAPKILRAPLSCSFETGKKWLSVCAVVKAAFPSEFCGDFSLFSGKFGPTPRSCRLIGLLIILVESGSFCAHEVHFGANLLSADAVLGDGDGSTSKAKDILGTFGLALHIKYKLRTKHGTMIKVLLFKQSIDRFTTISATALVHRHQFQSEH